jgi:hypothetical protein
MMMDVACESWKSHDIINWLWPVGAEVSHRKLKRYLLSRHRFNRLPTDASCFSDRKWEALGRQKQRRKFVYWRRNIRNNKTLHVSHNWSVAGFEGLTLEHGYWTSHLLLCVWMVFAMTWFCLQPEAVHATAGGRCIPCKFPVVICWASHTAWFLTWSSNHRPVLYSSRESSEYSQQWPNVNAVWPSDSCTGNYGADGSLPGTFHP